jgi:hypothetical protein
VSARRVGYWGIINPGNDTANANVLVYDYSPSASTTWQAHGVNLGTSGTTSYLIAQCLSFS